MTFASEFRKPDSRKPWLGLMLVLAIAITLLNFGRQPLFDEDEGEYGEVAVEMAHSGDYITPTLNGQPFFEKPILAFWLEAPLVKLFGVHEWVFRLPSAIACLLWVLLLVRFGQRYLGEEEGWVAGLFCATSLGVIVSGHAAAMDGVLSLLMAAAGFDIYRSWIERDRRAERRVYLWMALGFLAKGPVAVVVPFLLSGIFYATQGDLKRWAKSVFNPIGWVIFLLVALPWYLAQYRLMGSPFIDYFLFRENLGRLTGTLQGHGGSYFYYVPVLLLIVLPHTTLLLRAGIEGIRHRHQPLILFLLIWFAVVFGVFTLAHTKLPHYLLIGLTPVFLLMAQYRNQLRSRTLTLLPLGLMFALTLALPALATVVGERSHNPYFHEMLGRASQVFGSAFGIGIVVLAAVSAVIFLLLERAGASRQPWLLLTGAGLVGNLLVWMLWLPAAAGLQQEPVKAAAQVAKTLGQPIVADNRMPSFAVYSGRPTEHRSPRIGDVVFLRADHEAELPPHETLFHEGGLMLVKITSQ
jgi:4-amino-4-deoxy-L-arabinose transferase-like glycosyltransferase